MLMSHIGVAYYTIKLGRHSNGEDYPWENNIIKNEATKPIQRTLIVSFLSHPAFHGLIDNY